MTSTASTTSQQPLTPSVSTIRGRFLWHELLARDVDTAIGFYPAVGGWTVASMPSPEGLGTYTMLMNGDAPQAGIHPFPKEALAEGASPLWLPYIGTEDVDATLRDAVAAGATVLMSAKDLPTVGRIAVLRDPQGAQFAIYKPASKGMPETAPVAGEFAWHEMMADDADASFAFYSRLFGWENKHRMDMGKDGFYQMFGIGDFTYGGFMGRAPSMPPTSWNCYIRVADLDASVEAIKKGGGKIMMGPHEVPNNDRVVIAVDNQGAVISLVAKTVR